MATISKTNFRALDIKNSVQLKSVLSYLAIFIVLLVFMNVYPVVRVRDALFESKYASMLNQASVFASSLSSLAELESDEVKQVMGLLDDMGLSRIIIVNSSGRIIYDTADMENNPGKYVMFSEITRALSGKNVFYSSYSDSVLRSRAAIPVVYKGTTIGAVYIYEYDTDQAGLIAGLHENLLKVSYIMLIAALFLGVGFSTVLTSRIRSILRAVRSVGDGSYNYKITVKGRDELSELTEEFNNLISRLKKVEEIRQRFVSDASHELKTPLAAIRLLTDSIVQNEDMDKATVREFIYDIGAEAERLARITEKLLDLSRLTNEAASNSVPMEVKRVAEQALKMLRTLALKKNVTIESRFSGKCVIRANPDDIHQVVFNLIENAIKYNIDGGSVTVLLFKRDGRVYLIVNDTGIGIPREDMPNIFDRFYRVDKARSSDIGGSGLGLAIVKDMVYKHGGTVTATARDCGGTSFEVSFPAYEAAPGEKVQ
ncbi:MAG: HAMP domain-containing histidine kinase [Clostridiales bacterium]|nr:HAMP domain-containing histidine kinase [Clostridiales bacterium]